MEYMGSKEFWDDKFAARADDLLGPEASLVENIACFKKGSVLDIACGDGRNALYLLKRGFGVTGVDFSDKALERLKMFAQRCGYSIDTKQIDLSASDALADVGVFDNILINHYRLDKQILKCIGGHITGGGILFVCGFGSNHKADGRIREDDLIQPDDFKDTAESFELIKFTEQQDSRGCIVTYIFRKKAVSESCPPL